MATNFNLNQFRTQLKNGGVRPNQFQVRLTFPLYVDEYRRNLEASSFLVNVAELPGQTMGIAPVYYRGREIKLPGDKVFAPFTCTILNDSDMTLRKALEQWMNGIENVESKTGLTNPRSYLAPIEVLQLDRNGNTLRRYKLIDAFPMELSPIGLDFAANDTLSTFSVTFAYQHFEYYGVDGTKESTPQLFA